MRKKINWQEYIHTDPNVLVGKPTIKGTRISVERVLTLLSYGYTIDEVIESYPHLSKEQILSTLSYAADCLRTEALFEFTPIKTGTHG